MERVQGLIDKLTEQRARNDNAAQMLITVQLLQNELLQLHHKNMSRGTPKVSVIMPVSVMNQAGTDGMVGTIKQPEQEKQASAQAVDLQQSEIIKNLEPLTNKVVESPKST